MKVFKLPEKQIDSEMRKRLIRTLPIALIALIAGIYIGLSKTGTDSNLYIVLPIVIIISFFSIFIGILLGIRLNRESTNTYKIELLGDSVKKHQKNTPVIEISKSEITTITEVTKKGITIKTDNVNKFIFIPVYIEGYENLKESLSEWKEIKCIEKSSNQSLQVVSALGTVVGFGAIMLYDSPYIVIPVGIILSVVLLWSSYKIQTNPHVDSRLKKSSLITLLPIISIILKIWYVLKN